MPATGRLWIFGPEAPYECTGDVGGIVMNGDPDGAARAYGFGAREN